MAEPEKQAEAGGRDPKTGQFLPGTSGNPAGRPRGYDLRTAAEEFAKTKALSIATALGEALLAQLELAKTDTAAAKLVFSILGDTLTPDDAKESLAALIAATFNRARE